jgi:GNAT superfamily N-acetyltransferase
VGFLVVKPGDGALLLDHLYVQPGAQGCGIGAAVLALRDSASNRFYLRHGFQLVDRGEFDNHYLRP